VESVGDEGSDTGLTTISFHFFSCRIRIHELPWLGPLAFMKVNAVALGLVGVLGPGLKIYQFGFSPEKSLTKNCIFRYGWGDKPAGYQRFF
jgi:hypothetical protein